MKRNAFIAILISAVLAQLVLWLPLPLVAKSVAVLLFTGFLPGLLLVELWVGQSEAPPALGERLLYALAIGYGCMVIVMLGISYLPGGVKPWQTFLTFNLLLIILLTLTWWRRPTNDAHDSALRAQRAPAPSALLIGLLSLLLVGSFFRFTNLGYAEFHGDEARAILRAAGVMQGYEDVLFLHKKGPAEILLPATIFSLTGHMDEASARLPFAIANLATLLAVFLLGWQLLGPLAGWVAALLLAFDGYLIAFARFVQYQSLVLLTSVLTVLILYRLLRQPKALANYLSLAAALLATGILGHYEAAVAAAPAGFLFLVLAWQQRARWSAVARALGLAAVMGGALLASFFVPFIRHPHFEATSSYFSGRMDSEAPMVFHNTLADFFRRSIVYNSTYAVLLMIALVTLALVWAYLRGWDRKIGAVLSLAAVLVLALTFWRTEWLKLGATDFIFAPFGLAMLLIWVAPRLNLAERTLWLWFGAAMLTAFFLTATPRTHVYIFFVPWALLAGGVVAQGWDALAQMAGRPLAVGVGGAAAVLISAVFGTYAYWYFVYDRVEILRTWDKNRPAGYWTPFDAREVDSIYGFPLANGWKVIGDLYAKGVLQGDYETNQRYVWIPDWYTRGQHRCASTAQWYFAIDSLEPWAEDSQQITARVKSQGFKKWGVVELNNAQRLLIYQRTDDKTKKPLQSFRFDEYATAFNALAGPDLPLGYPVIENKIGHPLHINFDNRVWLEGYDLTYQAPLKPGDTFRLTLYWRAQQRFAQDYKVFNQSYYGNGTMVAQKDGYSVCDREPTTTWSPGKLITDVYDIPVADDAPAGVYPLYTGLYLEQTQARLPVLDAAGQAQGNQAHVTDLPVEVK